MPAPASVGTRVRRREVGCAVRDTAGRDRCDGRAVLAGGVVRAPHHGTDRSRARQGGDRMVSPGGVDVVLARRCGGSPRRSDRRLPAARMDRRRGVVAHGMAPCGTRTAVSLHLCPHCAATGIEPVIGGLCQRCSGSGRRRDGTPAQDNSRWDTLHCLCGWLIARCPARWNGPCVSRLVDD